MNRSRKILGMTMQQLGILAGLAGCACLLISLTGGWVLFGRGLSLSSPPEITPVVQLTSTPVQTATALPTETATPIPYELLIPDGWVQHSTALIELWLPPNFKNAGPNSVTVIAGDSVVLELALTGSASTSSVYKLFATVSYEPLSADTLDAFLDLRLANMPPEMSMAERRAVFVNSNEAERLIFESRIEGVFVNDLLYVFRDGGTVWYVKYSAQINEFYDMLPAFEESARTFRVVQ